MTTEGKHLIHMVNTTINGGKKFTEMRLWEHGYHVIKTNLMISSDAGGAEKFKFYNHGGEAISSLVHEQKQGGVLNYRNDANH